MPPTKTWKNNEREIARWFGVERNPLSGSNSKHTASDSLHEILFIETKRRKSNWVVTLWESVKELAKKEEKIPLVCLKAHNKKGFFIFCHRDDLLSIANQRQQAIKELGKNG